MKLMAASLLVQILTTLKETIETLLHHDMLSHYALCHHQMVQLLHGYAERVVVKVW